MLFLVQENELIWKRTFQVLYFYSAEVSFNQKMCLMLNKMETIHHNADFFAIDADYFNGVLRRFNINSLPTVVILKKSKEIKRITNILKTVDFMDIFSDICNL
jgi:hypothetical protein